MGTAVAVTNGSRGVMSIDLSQVNYGAAKSAIDKYIKSVGGGSGSKNFPGDQIAFKSGEWFKGIKDAKRPLKNGTKVIINVPNTMAGYVKWVGDEDSRKPVYTPMTFPAAGDDPIARDTLGDDDQDEWDTDDYGRPQDPWKPVLIFPVRSTKEGDETVHHIILETISKVIAGFNFFRDIMDEMKLHNGELPVVALGSKKASQDRDVTDKKTKKKKKVKQTWDVPTFEAAGWADAIDADNPAKGGVKVTDESADADLGTVETQARKSTNGNGKKAVAVVKTAKAAKAEKKVLASRNTATRTKTKIADEDEGEAF